MRNLKPRFDMRPCMCGWGKVIQCVKFTAEKRLKAHWIHFREMGKIGCGIACVSIWCSQKASKYFHVWVYLM